MEWSSILGYGNGNGDGDREGAGVAGAVTVTRIVGGLTDNAFMPGGSAMET